jgi:protocatechuate 3,4-dioxygenase beta subunit
MDRLRRLCAPYFLPFGGRRVVRFLLVLCTVVATPTTGQAQARSAGDKVEPPTGLTGTVVDSAGRPVAAAQLLVRETAKRGADARRWEARSDSTGRFRIEGLAPGALRLEVLRDAYEPAGFDIQIANGVMVDVRVRLVNDEMWQLAKRAADSLARADSAAAAAVRGRSGAPLMATTLRNAPSATSPPAADTAVARSSGTTDVTLSTAITATLPSGGAPVGPRRPGAPANLLTGRVLTQEGEPVVRVQVQAMGTTLFTMTDSTGRFFFRDLAPGPYFVRARKVGYEPVVFTATLAAIDSLEASVRFTALTAANTTRLDTVRTTAEYDRMSRRLRGFEERRANIRGLFIDREEVAMRKPQLLSDLLRGRANITVQRNGTGDTQIFGTRISISTGYCPLALILDGTLINTNGGRMDNFVPIDMVAAIEVYNSGTSVPGQFARPETDCGAVIVWTR